MARGIKRIPPGPNFADQAPVENIDKRPVYLADQPPRQYSFSLKSAKHGFLVGWQMDVDEFFQGEFTLDIPNFEKWNPPIKDKKTGENHEVQHRTYIKLSMHFFDDPKIQGLSNVDQTFYLRLVILRATSPKPIRNLSTTYLQRIHNMPGRSVVASLLKLLESGLIILSKERKKERKKEEKEEETGPVEPTEGLQPQAQAARHRFTEKQLQILGSQFNPPFLEQHLPDAVACWDTYDEFRKSQTPLIKTVQSYLKIQRDKPPETRNRTLTEMVEAGEFVP